MIAFQNFIHLADIDLGTPKSKPTSIDGEQLEASKVLWTSPDGAVTVGVWECTPGRFSAYKESVSEICHFVSGRVSLHDEDGRTQELRAGELLVLPQGWKGEWTIHEKTRKLYMTQRA